MNLFVDTSVWSLALRRDSTERAAEAVLLSEALDHGGAVFTTGLVLQELLQGFTGPKARDRLVQRFSALPFLMPDRTDHIEAAAIRNTCRRKGVQVGTVDALLARLCIHHELMMLTADRDFTRVARYTPLRVWSG